MSNGFFDDVNEELVTYSPNTPHLHGEKPLTHEIPERKFSRVQGALKEQK